MGPSVLRRQLLSEAGNLAGAGKKMAPDFRQVFAENAAAVSRWAAGLGGPSVDVEDVVQEVFIVAHRRLPEFRGDAQISTWLFRITDRVVRYQRRRARFRRFLRGSADETAGQMDSGRLSPVEELERKEAVRSLYAVLDRMNEKYRTVLVLTRFEGWSADQIAATTGVTATTVRVWLHRALVQFKKLAEKSQKEIPR